MNKRFEMKTLLISFILISPNLLAMGDPEFIPANPVDPKSMPDVRALSDPTLRNNQIAIEADQKSPAKKQSQEEKQNNANKKQKERSL